MQISKRGSHAVTDLESTRTDHWRFLHAAASDVGQRRDTNEDFFLLYPDRQLYVVADGMGGHAAGDVASRIAAETLSAYFDTADLPDALSGGEPDPMLSHLTNAVEMANDTIVEAGSERSDRQGMGTTVVALAFRQSRVYWAHVGDSRLYRFRRAALERMTRDHSLLQQTLDARTLDEQEQQTLVDEFPYKNVLTRALGSQASIDVDVDSAPMRDGDVFVLTTDGVHDVIGDEQIEAQLRAHENDWSAACEAVVAEANRLGGPDNATIACVEIQSL